MSIICHAALTAHRLTLNGASIAARLCACVGLIALGGLAGCATADTSEMTQQPSDAAASAAGPAQQQPQQQAQQDLTGEQIAQLAGQMSAMSMMLQALSTELTEIRARQITQERDTARINSIADSVGLLHRKVDYLEKQFSSSLTPEGYYGEGDVSSSPNSTPQALLPSAQSGLIEQNASALLLPTPTANSPSNLNTTAPNVTLTESPVLSVAAAPRSNSGAALNVDELLALGDTRPALHIASLKDISRVNESWAELAQRYPQQLANLDWRISAVDLPGRGQYYRLKAGPIASRREADRLCAELKARQKYCKVVNFTGTRP